MTDKQLITQLKSLKSIHPDNEWVDLTRSRLLGEDVAEVKRSRNIFDIFSFSIPRFVAIGTLAGIVMFAGGIHIYTLGLVSEEVDYIPALSVSFRHDQVSALANLEATLDVSITNVDIANTFQDEVEALKGESDGSVATTQDKTGSGIEDESSHTVVFSEDAQERDNFQALLRERVEIKISTIKDLFDQLENTDLALERELNPRRFEENFEVLSGEQGEKVKELLNEAEFSLAEGDLITALDLVNAIEKLIKD